jgi:hypothetical protein
MHRIRGVPEQQACSKTRGESAESHEEVVPFKSRAQSSCLEQWDRAKKRNNGSSLRMP